MSVDPQSIGHIRSLKRIREIAVQCLLTSEKLLAVLAYGKLFLFWSVDSIGFAKHIFATPQWGRIVRRTIIICIHFFICCLVQDMLAIVYFLEAGKFGNFRWIEEALKSGSIKRRLRSELENNPRDHYLDIKIRKSISDIGIF